MAPAEARILAVQGALSRAQRLPLVQGRIPEALTIARLYCAHARVLLDIRQPRALLRQRLAFGVHAQAVSMRLA